LVGFFFLLTFWKRKNIDLIQNIDVEHYSQKIVVTIGMLNWSCSYPTQPESIKVPLLQPTQGNPIPISQSHSRYYSVITTRLLNYLPLHQSLSCSCSNCSCCYYSIFMCKSLRIQLDLYTKLGFSM
jgi:hypothetical protein